jgi:ATPase family associated with various cellular activities (AAA)
MTARSRQPHRSAAPRAVGRRSLSYAALLELRSDPFAHLLTVGRQARGTAGPTTIYIVVVDEADALAQSRAAQQMHHEDRAGVDGLLAGVDSLAGEQVPVLAVMCTNREHALDPAVLRRTAAIFHFRRPGDAQRRTVVASALDGTGIVDATISKLVSLTGAGIARSDRRRSQPGRARYPPCGPRAEQASPAPG